MSCKRARYLVEAMNAHFRGGPLVETTKGGPKGAGARLTALGEDVFGAFARWNSWPTKLFSQSFAARSTRLADSSKRYSHAEISLDGIPI
jgi:molybdate transport system regulatory protein